MEEEVRRARRTNTASLWRQVEDLMANPRMNRYAKVVLAGLRD
jgi:hypothetical protein